MSCGTDEHGEIKLYTPVKAIRRKCLDCCCGSSKEVGLCTVVTCSLYPYRFGKNPSRKGTRQPPKGIIPPGLEKHTTSKSQPTEILSNE